MISQYTPDNPDMSQIIHDQGGTAQCWSYSTTTSIRNTWKRTLKQMDDAKKNGKWNGHSFDYTAEIALSKSSSTFLEIRNLLLMSIIPKKIHIKDMDHAAYVRAAIVRVCEIISIIFIFGMILYRILFRLLH